MTFIDDFYDGPARPIARPLGLGRQNPFKSPVIPSLPTNAQGMLNKYAEMAPIIAALPDDVRNALINLDAQRVARGGRALSTPQTVNALNTVLQQKAATPPPDRSPLDVLGNLRRDAQDILSAIPRLPVAVYHAATHPSEFVNFIPGAYVGQQIARGSEGVKELTTHPLMAGLDVLPLASVAARATPVGKVAVAQAAESGARARPLAAVATRSLDEAGELVPNRLARVGQSIRDNTRIGQALDTTFGQRNRDVMREADMGRARVQAQMLGWVDDGTDIESATRASHELLQEFSSFDNAKIAKLTERMQMGDLTGLADDELAYVGRAIDINARIGKHGVSVDELGEILDPTTGRTEFMPLQQARKARVLQRNARQLEDYSFAREQVANPTLDADVYVRAAREAIDAPAALSPRHRRENVGTLGQGERRTRVRAAIYALEAKGHNVDDLKALETKAHNTGNWDELRAALDQPLTSQVAYSAEEIISTLRRYRRDVVADRLATAIADGEWSRVTKTLDTINQRTGPASIPELLDDAAFSRSIRDLRDRSRFLDKRLGFYTERRATSARDKADRYIAETPPARFIPRVIAKADERVAARYAPHDTTPEQAAAIAQMVTERRYHALPGYKQGEFETELMGVRRDVAKTWRDMQAQGIDPVYVHMVHPDALKFGPRVGEVPTTLTQVKERTLDFSPGVNDVSVALSHQGMEYLQRAQSEVFLEWFTQKYGVSVADVRAEMLPRARAIAKADPRLAFGRAEETAIARKYTKFDPAEHGYTWGSKRLDAIKAEQKYIPNALAKNLKAMNNPKSPLGGIFDPITRVFRVAVIGLSPRTHLYNTLGNAVQVLGRTDPRAFKYMREAVRMARDPSIAPDSLKLLLGQTRRAFDDLDKPSQGALLQATSRYMAGRSFGRIWKSIQESKVAKAGGKVVSKSYDLNSLMDDTFRAMTYMFERDNVLRKLGPEAAAKADAAGVALTRRVLMDYSGMTAVERTVMRSIIPFYSFVSHAARYAFSYPIDHSVRAFILSKLADIELDELNDTLPTRFLSSLFITDPDEGGSQTALSLAALNPFGDVANSMTVAGFLGNTNPLISTLLETVGVERGEAELYPTLRYNPETGRLEGSHPNPLMAFAENVIPQTQVLTGLLGFNSDLSDRMRRDPAGARRTLISAVGVPILWRQYNVPQEQMKAEVARMSATNDVRLDALKSGDWSNAMRYPTLRAYFEQIQALPQELLKPMIPGSDYEERIKQVVTSQLGQPQPVVGRPAVGQAVAGGNLAATAGGI